MSSMLHKSVEMPMESLARLASLASRTGGSYGQDVKLIEQCFELLDEYYDYFEMLPPDATMASNILYVISAGPFFKIGVSTDVFARMKAIQTSNPYPIELTGFYNIPRSHWGKTEHTGRIEKLVHKELAEFRGAGEWFNCDLSYVKSAVHDVVRKHARLGLEPAP